MAAMASSKARTTSVSAEKQPGRPPGRPPNGGWGWVVVLGVAMSYMTNMALFSVFGLLFGGQLERWGLATTGVAVISSTMNTIQNFSGLLVGPLVKRLGGKAVSLLGGALIAAGMMLSFFATDPWQIFITWGFLVGLGLGLLVPSTFLNINSYFTTRRSQAVGLALAGTGLGQILMPHLVRLLLETYGFHGAVLVLGAVALHSLPGCLLYRKPRLVRDPEEPHETQPLNPPSPASSPGAASAPAQAKTGSSNAVAAGGDARRCEDRGVLAAARRLAHSLDLDLLANLRFMNLAVGTGLIYTTQTSFSMIFPFFMMESVGLSAAATATCMSVQSVADLLARLLLPQLMSGAVCRSRCCNRCCKGGGGGGSGGGFGRAGLAARTVMLVGALGSAGSRSVMAELTGFPELLVLSAVSGGFRGATVLNQNLVVAEHVPAAKLPAAIGMAMVVKGACVLGLGSALGVVRDKTGSYPMFIHSLTLLAMVTSLSWMLESLLCPPRKATKAAVKEATKEATMAKATMR